jgi:hypothetical protein
VLPAAPATGSGALPAPLAAPIGTAFTYQGRLELAGSPVSGPCDLQFQLFDALTGGTQLDGTQTLLSVPRSVALRSFLIHHVIHHRGQMTVYLRLQNVPLPPMYGATADERP